MQANMRTKTHVSWQGTFYRQRADQTGQDLAVSLSLSVPEATTSGHRTAAGW